MESDIGTSKKKTLGRRKIEIKKIEKKTSLQVTFAKRRRGLFRKASELAVLCGAEVAILVQSPAQKMYAFGHPSVGALLDRVSSPSPPAAAGMQVMRRCDDEEGRRKLEEAEMELEMEKRRAAEISGGGGFWWEESVEGLGVQELEEYLKALEDMEGNVSERLNEFEKAKKIPSPSIQDFCNSSSIQELCNDPSIQDFCNSSSIQEFCNDPSIQDFCNASSIQDFWTSSSSIQESEDGFSENPFPLMIEDAYGLEILDFQDYI